MALENEINQRKFRTEYQKARINIIYTYNWLSEKVNSIFEEREITPRQFNILRILRGEGKPLSTLQIRQRMLDKMSDTSRIVDRLLIKGLVKKTPNSGDRRLVDIVITPKGRKLLEKIDPFEDDADKFMENLSEEETKTLNRLLDKLRNTMALLLVITMAGLFTPAHSQPPAPVTLPAPATLPAPTTPKYEFRAAWVASVENIDWPSKKGLPVDSQKVEFTRLLDMHKRNGFKRHGRPDQTRR